jgi:hypothetical protein
MPRPLLILSLLMVSLLGPCGRNPTQGQILTQTQFRVPENPVLNTKDDYSKYEGDIIAAAKWLEETDLDKETDKREQVNAFLTKWIAGSPTVTVSLDELVTKIVDKNPPLLFIYIASYSRSVLLNRASPNTLLAVKDGVISVIKVYKKGIGLVRNRQLEKLSKMDQDSQVEDYILNAMKVQKA